MWFIQPKRDYIAAMPWKHADEPVVMAWQIRVRDYNTFIANLYFVFIFMVSFAVGGGLFYAMYSYNESVFYALLLGGGSGFFVLLIGMSISHQTTIIVYRLTDKRIEVVSWKPQVDSVKPVMKWTAIISGVAVLFLVLVNPDLIMAAIGPVGIGVMAALMGNSKDHQSMLRNSQHYEIDWQDAEEMAVWRKRAIIGFRFTYYNEDGSQYTGYKTLYCHRAEFENRIAFFKEKLPTTPYRECKLDVESHFAFSVD